MNHIHRTLHTTILALLLLGPAAPALADVKVSPLFADHMVLQHGVEAPVWGTADAGEPVTVTVGDRKATATADASGKWLTKVGPLQPGGPVELSISGKNNSLTIKNVLVGEVWVCSGQSNMEWSVNASGNPEQERAAANYPAIRMFTVKKAVTGKPARSLEGTWQVCNPQNVGGFSAVGYYFGRELHKSLNVPVGLIHTSWGGTPAESWTEPSALEADSDFRPILDRWKQQYEKFQKELPAQFAAAVEKWKPQAEKAEADGRPVPPVPVPQDPRASPWRPSGLYNAMITPLLPYGIKGAIWYQGESNAGRAYQYRKLLPAMIGSWRKAWGQGDFPFYIVSLANFTPVKDEPGESDWAELREAQTMTADTVPNSGQAITIDIGEATDIHPKNKQDVGRRLALVALAKTYRKDVPFSGPTYDSMKAEGDAVRLTFKHTHGGLVARGEKLKGFAVAGEDRKWHWADAKIDGDSVVVRSDKVAKPVAVRYAWANNPVCNLYNQAGLPAVPFRTDDWKGVTADAR